MAHTFTNPLSFVQEASSASVRLFGLATRGASSRRRSVEPSAAHAHSSSDVAPTRSHTASSSGAEGLPFGSSSSFWNRWPSWEMLRKSTQAVSAAASTLVAPLSSMDSKQVTFADSNKQEQSELSFISRELKAKPYLSEFLTECDAAEVNYGALLADLSDMAYEVGLINEESLLDRHHLQLVCSSQTPVTGPLTREAWSAQVQEQRSHSAKAKPTVTEAAVPAEQQRAKAVEPSKQQHRQQQQSADTMSQISNAAAVIAQAALLADHSVSQELVSHRLSVQGLDMISSSPAITPSVSLVALSSLEGEGSGQDTQQIPVLTFVPSNPTSPSNMQANHISSTMQSRFNAMAAELASAAPSPHALDVKLPPAVARTGQSGSQTTEVSLPVLQHSAQRQMAPEPVSSQAGALAINHQPPAAWFACDDAVTKIRYIVIQGSTTLEHWQINLQFEPVIFEDPALGVRVHRGVYEAALRLYDDLVPLVRQHLSTSPFASVTFTGHSLGGSLATVLMLLMVHRGVIPPHSVSPTYTFGAPAVFCGGAVADPSHSRCETCALNCPHANTSANSCSAGESGHACAKPRGLLAQLGLGEEHIMNVIMHRDIVPRAFVCDYALVADLLVQWLPSLKNLAGLQTPNNEPKSLYSFLGRTAVLQPDTGCSFVQPSDAKHPFLPDAAGLYRLVAPAPRMTVHAMHGSFDLTCLGSPSKAPQAAHTHSFTIDDDDEPYGLSSLSDDDSAATQHRFFTPSPVRGPLAIPRRHRSVSRPMKAAKVDRDVRVHAVEPEAMLSQPISLKQAVQHFMNNPHPLTTLSEYAAYGPNGSISRYHNPRNYTLGLLALIGRAPHQTSKESSPPVALQPACPTGSAHGAGTACVLEVWDDLHHLCSNNMDLSELAVSPEALRLIRSSPADNGDDNDAPSVQHRRSTEGKVGSSSAAAMKSSSFKAARRSNSPSIQLPQLPVLGPFLSAVGCNVAGQANQHRAS